MQTNTESGKLSYIIRDHDREKFEQRKRFIKQCAEKMNEKYGEGTVTADVNDQYYNMKEKIEPDAMHVIDLVLRAMQEVGVAPKVKPIRGGPRAWSPGVSPSAAAPTAPSYHSKVYPAPISLPEA